MYSLSPGKNSIDNDNIFINRFSYTGLLESKCFFEGHKNYLDIHILLSGCKNFGYTDISELKQITEYDSENDFIKFQGTVKNYIKLEVGDFILAFPEDIPMPKININNESIEKIVCKVML